MRNTFIRAGIIACLFSWLTLAFADQPASQTYVNQQFNALCAKITGCTVVF